MINLQLLQTFITAISHYVIKLFLFIIIVIKVIMLNSLCYRCVYHQDHLLFTVELRSS